MNTTSWSDTPVGTVSIAQVTPAVEVRIVPESPTTTYCPSAKVTPFKVVSTPERTRSNFPPFAASDTMPFVPTAT